MHFFKVVAACWNYVGSFTFQRPHHDGLCGPDHDNGVKGLVLGGKDFYGWQTTVHTVLPFPVFPPQVFEQIHVLFFHVLNIFRCAALVDFDA